MGTLILNIWPRTALLVLFAAGGLFTLAFAPFYWWPLAFISLPIFHLLLTTSASTAQAMWRGFAFGYGFFMAGTWWIGNALLVDAAKFGWLLPFSILGLSAVMALWFVPFAFVVHRLRLHNPLTFAATWVVFELGRSIGMFGFPWNLAGYVGLASLEVAQFASITGVYGLSFVVIWVALVPVYFARSRATGVAASVVGIALLGVLYVYGSLGLQTPVHLTSTAIRLVQPSIPQEIKNTQKGFDESLDILGNLSVQKSEGAAQPAITIWPETAYPFPVKKDSGLPGPRIEGVLITGAVRRLFKGETRKLWNSLIAFAPKNGNLLASYDKHQLVPFGEFVPLRNVLPLDKITPGNIDFSRGTGPMTLKVEGVPPFSAQVCYEGIFPQFALDSNARPEWMLNVTNDGWYGETPGPYQHFEMTRMRAIEQGLPMVRSANSGISAIIDAKGRVLGWLQLNRRAILDGHLPAAGEPTLYAKFTNIPILFVCVIILIVGIFQNFRHKK